MTRIRVVQQDQLPDGSRRVILAVEYGAQVAGIELPVINVLNCQPHYTAARTVWPSFILAESQAPQ